jgi:hypothetical protein
MRIISRIEMTAIVINSQFMMNTLYQIYIFLQHLKKGQLTLF